MPQSQKRLNAADFFGAEAMVGKVQSGASSMTTALDNLATTLVDTSLDAVAATTGLGPLAGAATGVSSALTGVIGSASKALTSLAKNIGAVALAGVTGGLSLLGLGFDISSLTDIAKSASQVLLGVAKSLFDIAKSPLPGGAKILEEAWMLFAMKLGVKVAPIIAIAATAILTLGDAIKQTFIDGKTSALSWIDVIRVTMKGLQGFVAVLGIMGMMLVGLGIAGAKYNEQMAFNRATALAANPLASKEEKDAAIKDLVDRQKETQDFQRLQKNIQGGTKELYDNLGKALPKFGENFGKVSTELQQLFATQSGARPTVGTEIGNVWKEIQSRLFKSQFETDMLRLQAEAVKGIGQINTTLQGTADFQESNNKASN